jgi:hypothetical protein
VVSYELLPIVAETRLRNERKRTYNARYHQDVTYVFIHSMNDH